MSEEKVTFKTPTGWGTVTGDYMVSDEDNVILVHKAIDDKDADE